MSTNTLVSRSAGETVNAPDVNQFRTAFDGALVPRSSGVPANDGGALGSTTYKWSDLFLASGSVINFDSSNMLITHSSDLLTISSGNLTLSHSSPVLKIESNDDTNAKITLNAGATSDTIIVMEDNGVGTWAFGMNASNSNAFQISNGSGFGVNDYITLQTSGYVGINTTNPSSLLGGSCGLLINGDPGDQIRFGLRNARTWVMENDGANGDALTFRDGTSSQDRFRITAAGLIQFGTHTSIGAETLSGYITMQDIGGTNRKLAVVS